MQKPKNFDEKGLLPDEQYNKLLEVLSNYRREVNSRQLTDYYPLKKAKDGYVCPICGSGTGRKGTGGLKISKDNRIRCFANNCFSSSKTDTTDTLGALMIIEKKTEQEVLESYTNYNYEQVLRDIRQSGTVAAPQSKPVAQQPTAAASANTQPEQREQAPTKDFTEYFNACHERLKSTPWALEYFHSRGLSDETIDLFNLGCDIHNGHREAVVPYPGCNYYCARNLDYTDDNKNGHKYRKPTAADAGTEPLFNRNVLLQNEPIFIVEGAFCAMAINQLGGQALALITTGITAEFKRTVTAARDKGRFDSVFVVCLDKDENERGQQGQAKMVEWLQENNFPYIEAAIQDEFKDPGELMEKDAARLKRNIEEARKTAAEHLFNIKHEAELKEQAEREKLLQEYNKNNTKNYIDGFISEMKRPENTTYYPTGFNSLDELLDGGLYNGLYCIGAISSLGKTTFCLQLIDQIAKQGHDVLIFSLEMARHELMAKSLSRCTYIESLDNYGHTRHAKTTRGLMSGSRYDNYSIDEMRVIHAAMERYSSYADHIFIYEGVGDIGVNEIAEKVKQHKTITGRAPVVLIDYLQILAPYNEHATDKQNTDKAVLELKRISRDYHIPVIGISSFNRDNYTAPVNMASFKESGAVEYSSDVLLALQYEGMDWKEGESEKDRNARVRTLMSDVTAKGKRGEAQKIQVKVLKNRNGSKGDCCLDFIPMFNCFMEAKTIKTAAREVDSEGFMPLLEGQNPFEQ